MQFRRLILFFSVPLLLGSYSDDDSPVRIGLVAGISGSNADLGQAGRNGAMLAVEETNKDGGINGRPVELVIRDDGNTPAMAILAAKELVAEKVAAIVGPFTSGMAETVLTVTEPSFSRVIAYGVTTALVKAMAEKTDEQILKSILANSPYEGLQQTLKMDKFGGSRRDSHFVVIQGTEFIPAK